MKMNIKRINTETSYWILTLNIPACKNIAVQISDWTIWNEYLATFMVHLKIIGEILVAEALYNFCVCAIKESVILKY